MPIGRIVPGVDFANRAVAAHCGVPGSKALWLLWVAVDPSEVQRNNLSIAWGFFPVQTGVSVPNELREPLFWRTPAIAVVSGGSANGSLLRASTSRANGSDDAPPRIVVVTVGAMVDPINAGVGGRDSTDPSLRLDALLCLIKHIAKTRATRTASASGIPRPMASLPEEESPEPESLVSVVARLAGVDCELAVMVTNEVTVADDGTAEGADADVDTDEADADAGTDVDADAAVVVAADVVGPSLLVRYSCTSLGKEVNQLGFFPSRNSDHKMAETSGKFVAAICLKDEGIAVKRTSAKDSLLCE
ncbi:hypothetical protein AB5N19_02548 [Seiridium cardinale]